MGNYVFALCAEGFTVYYNPGATGFTNPWYGYPTKVFFINKNCPSENILGVDNPNLENLRFFATTLLPKVLWAAG